MRKLNQKGFTLIELMIVVAIIGILAAVAVSGLSTIGQMKVSGHLVKCSKVGLFWKTNEVEVMMGGINSGKESVDLSCKDESLFAVCEDAFEKTETVKISYDTYFIQAPWHGNTKTQITAVEAIPDPAAH